MFTLKSFYKSKEWEKFRNIVINDSIIDGHVRCAHCGKSIVARYDTIVHHKQELNEANVNDYNISLNPANVEVICFNCHNKEHARFGYEHKKKVFIVYGSPLSGKSSWVREVAQPNDLIVDMDNIHQMISVNDRYDKNDRLNSVVFEVRDKLYDLIKYRSGKWQNAYVIAGLPLIGDRERLSKRLNTDELIFIECDKEECIKRLDERAMSDEARAKWREYIEDWFNKYCA